MTGSIPASRDITRAGDGTFAFETAGAAPGDRSDLSPVDAKARTSGVQDFVFGTATGRGRLRAATSGSDTQIRGDNESDTAADFLA